MCLITLKALTYNTIVYVMVNMHLFKSTLVSSAAQLYSIYYYNPPLYYSLFLTGGICTSLLNHSLSSVYIQYADRIYMIYGIFMLYNIGQTIYIKISPIIPALLYICSKYTKLNIYHVCAHICITIINIVICSSI